MLESFEAGGGGGIIMLSPSKRKDVTGFRFVVFLAEVTDMERRVDEGPERGAPATEDEDAVDGLSKIDRACRATSEQIKQTCCWLGSRLPDKFPTCFALFFLQRR